ncbi:hypothetical protein EVAR_51722_1 [Eumeta japonica]|uniref:Uncharacterized protein n=1 Tax=Eumeta variegata TaxID=151549 RepID=A0A4C1XI49_EUMVA|nr:hypothetical protein EVAR_51722_1 [Eumeta japonica]
MRSAVVVVVLLTEKIPPCNLTRTNRAMNLSQIKSPRSWSRGALPVSGPAARRRAGDARVHDPKVVLIIFISQMQSLIVRRTPRSLQVYKIRTKV